MLVPRMWSLPRDCQGSGCAFGLEKNQSAKTLKIEKKNVYFPEILAISLYDEFVFFTFGDTCLCMCPGECVQVRKPFIGELFLPILPVEQTFSLLYLMSLIACYDPRAP